MTIPIDLDKVFLSWDKATDAQTTQNTLTYNVRFGTTSGGNELSPSMSGSSGYRQIPSSGNAGFSNSGFPVRNLTTAKAYYWSVQAVDQAYAGGPWSNERVFTLLPAPVAGVSTAKFHAGFTANWSPTTGAAGYIIDVATDNSFTSMVTGYSARDAGNVTNFAITGLSPVTNYYYRVRAYITGAVSLFNSNTVETTTYPVPPPSPTGLTVSSCNDNVTLTWNAVTTPYSFRRYRIFGGTTENPTTQIDSTTLGQVSATSLTLSNLTHGQTYYFRIKSAIDPGVAGDFSTSVSVKVKKGVIPQIKSKWGNLLIAYNKGDSIASFQWFNGVNPVSGATQQFYAANKNAGSYHVQTIDKNGCKNVSNTIIPGTKSLSIYPNPASSSFILTLKCESTGKTMVRIVNSSGTRVIEYQTEKKDPELKSEIEIRTLQSGIYTIEVLVDNEEKLSSRLVVIK